MNGLKEKLILEYVQNVKDHIGFLRERFQSKNYNIRAKALDDGYQDVDGSNVKKCIVCDKVIFKNKKYSKTQWQNQKCCSPLCQSKLPRIYPLSYFEDIALKTLTNTVITDNGCWEYQGRTNPKDRYGRSCVCRKQVTTHNLIYRLVKGNVQVGFEVCHTCDYPPCINPEHLFKGTRTDNMQDCVKKNRTRRYLDVYGAKLNMDNVQTILKLGRTDIYHKDIADLYGVSKSAISQIMRKHNIWRRKFKDESKRNHR